jgi:uncharacterized protein (DUF885 family)
MKKKFQIIYFLLFCLYTSFSQTNTVASTTGGRSTVDSNALKQLMTTKQSNGLQSPLNRTNTVAGQVERSSNEGSNSDNDNGSYSTTSTSSNSTPTISQTTTDVLHKTKAQSTSQFTTYKDKFLERLWRIYPEWATSVGYHLYDSVLTIPNDSFRKNEARFVGNAQNMLNGIEQDSLSIADRMDLLLIRNFLIENNWSRAELRQYEWDPSMYNIAGNFSFILTENYQTLDTRLKALYSKMNYVKAYYEAAKNNLKNPTKEHTDLAIKQIKSSIPVFTIDMLDSLKKSKLSSEVKIDFIKKANDCAKSMADFVTYLESLNMDNARSFRLGATLYEAKFNYEIQSSYSSASLLQMAIDRKKYLHTEMATIADKLWTKYFGNKPKPTDNLLMIKAVIDTISYQHVKPENFQSTIEKQIPVLVKFINDKNLIYLDPTKPLKVRAEPSYMAGVAGASISSPGPYDKNGTTYYNVGSLNGMGKAEQESYLKEYNDYILQILSIHEAIPGHYTQGIYANQSPSIIKSILGNGSMVEGWAVYSELMMLENGYGNNSPEMWLMYYKWNLRSVCNTILDISVHTANMSHDDAIKLLVNDAFQQSAEAEGKWRRVQLTSVQLCSYFNGFKEILDLRDELKKNAGSRFDLKRFNEKLLSFGSSPVKDIRQMIIHP